MSNDLRCLVWCLEPGRASESTLLASESNIKIDKTKLHCLQMHVPLVHGCHNRDGGTTEEEHRQLRAEGEPVCPFVLEGGGL